MLMQSLGLQQPHNPSQIVVWLETKSSLPHIANVGKIYSVQKSLTLYSNAIALLILLFFISK